jgi:hypothetical protein
MPSLLNLKHMHSDDGPSLSLDQQLHWALQLQIFLSFDPLLYAQHHDDQSYLLGDLLHYN